MAIAMLWGHSQSKENHPPPCQKRYPLGGVCVYMNECYFTLRDRDSHGTRSQGLDLLYPHNLQQHEGEVGVQEQL